MFTSLFLKTKHYKLTTKKGFTLVEVLVSIVILVVVIGGIVALESGNIKTGTSSKYNLQANGLGQQTFNAVKSIGDKIKLDNTTPAPIPNECVDPNDAVTCPVGVYYLSVTTNKIIKCPSTDKVVVGSETICQNDDAKRDVNGKIFYNTVIFP